MNLLLQTMSIYTVWEEMVSIFFLTTFAVDQYNTVCIMAVLGLGVHGGVEIILVASCYGNPGPKETGNTFKHQSEWPLSSNSDLTFYES